MKKLGGFLLVSLAMAIVAHSQTYDNTFNGAVDNKWNTVGNWSTGSLPGSGDSVSINYGENKSGKVELENDITVGDLNFYHNPAGWASSGFTGSGTINADSFTISGYNGNFSMGNVSLNIKGEISTVAILVARYIRADTISFGSGGNCGLEYTGTGTAENQNLFLTGAMYFNGGGNVILTGSSGEYYTTVGGISGSGGNLQVKNNTSVANAYLTINVAEGQSYKYSGEISNKKNYWDSNPVENKTINMTKTGLGSQYFTNKNRVELTSVRVSEGVIGMAASLDQNLMLDGGYFSMTVGNLSAVNIEWYSGGLIFDKTALDNGHKIELSGELLKMGEGPIEIDFDYLDGSEYIGKSFELISSSSGITILNGDANEDFIATNLTGALADFAWNDNILSVTFTNVPEPASIAALFGLAVLAFAVRRRK